MSKRAESMKRDTEWIIYVIMVLWIDKGEGSTVKEIADFTGLNEGRVRRILNEEVGSEVASRKDYRTSFSTDYSGMETGCHRVFLYEPSKAHLRSMILSTGVGLK